MQLLEYVLYFALLKSLSIPGPWSPLATFPQAALRIFAVHTLGDTTTSLSRYTTDTLRSGLYSIAALF